MIQKMAGTDDLCWSSGVLRSFVTTKLHLQCEANMAISQSHTGKFSESNWRFAKLIRTLTSACFLGDWMTLSVRLHYTGSRLRQLGTVRPANITLDALQIVRRVLGEHHVTTMACIANLARHISRQSRSIRRFSVHRSSC